MKTIYTVTICVGMSDVAYEEATESYLEAICDYLNEADLDRVVDAQLTAAGFHGLLVTAED